VSESEATRLLRQEEVFTDDVPVDPTGLDLQEEVISLNRVAKVVKGGRRFSFSALVVVGDKKNYVGLGFGKANEVPESIGKAVENARANLMRVPRLGRTIPHLIIGRFGAARIMLRPAAPGTGLIAGQAVRAVMDLGGIHDILTKNLGSDNVLNVLKATMNGLRSMLRAERVAWLRGKGIEEMVGPRRAKLYLAEQQMRSGAGAAAADFEPQAASFGGGADEMLPGANEAPEPEPNPTEAS
jgi:small subunit ribosomal protein S5